MTDLTPERRAAIAARCAQATGGEWTCAARTDAHDILAALEVTEQQLAALVAAANQALGGLADLVCVHGAAFDSNEYTDWDSHCPACAALRPLVQALAAQPAAADGGQGA